MNAAGGRFRERETGRVIPCLPADMPVLFTGSRGAATAVAPCGSFLVAYVVHGRTSINRAPSVGCAGGSVPSRQNSIPPLPKISSDISFFTAAPTVPFARPAREGTRQDTSRTAEEPSCEKGRAARSRPIVWDRRRSPAARRMVVGRCDDVRRRHGAWTTCADYRGCPPLYLTGRAGASARAYTTGGNPGVGVSCQARRGEGGCVCGRHSSRLHADRPPRPGAIQQAASAKEHRV